MDMTGTISRLVVSFPKSILAIFFALAVLGALQLPKLEADPSPQLLAPDHRSRVAIERLREDFTGANSSIIVMLACEESIFTTEFLARVKKLTLAFEAMHLLSTDDRDALKKAAEGYDENIKEQLLALADTDIDSDTWLVIDELKETLEFSEKDTTQLMSILDLWLEKLSPIKKVSSLSSTDNILGSNNRLIVEPIFESVPKTHQEISMIEKQVISNEIFQNLLVSNKGKNTTINIELNLPESAVDERYLIYLQVKDILENRVPGPESHYIAGMTAVTAALGKIMKDDSKKLFLIVILIIMACLLLTFRRAKGLFIPMAVVLLSLIVTIGLKAFLGIPLNIITISLPVFILSIGVADGIHIFSEYHDNLHKGFDKISAVKETIHHLALPVIMTSLTTGAAFFAISITEIVQLRHCGLFICFGALVAMVYSLFFIPSLLMVLPEKRSTESGEKIESGFEKKYASVLIYMTRQVLNMPLFTIIAAGIVFSVFLFGASKVKVDNNSVNFFNKESDIYISSGTLNTQGAGSSRINFIITDNSNEPEPFKKPENLRHIERFLNFLKQQPVVGKAMGLTELIKRIYFVINNEKPDFNRLPVTAGKDPESKNLISQLLLLYENGGGDTLSDYTDSSYTSLNLPVGLKTNSSLVTKEFTDKVGTYVRKNFPDNLKVEISGPANVEAATTEEIVTGQITGLTVSMLVVLIMLMITFHRLGFTLIAMIPLVMTVTINFGVMGFCSIPLDVGTSIISSVVIGIGVDYSIHYLSRLKKNRASGMAFFAALDNTVTHSGKAIVSNAITVGFGFMALWFSVLNPLKIMGWFITLTMIISALSALILLPVFYYYTIEKCKQTI